MTPEIQRLIEQWRTGDANDAKARGYWEAWNTYQVCANELEALLAASPPPVDPPPLESRMYAARKVIASAIDLAPKLSDAYEDLSRAIAEVECLRATPPAPPVDPPPTCQWGHKARVVGCVSCVLVFDRPAECATPPAPQDDRPRP